MRFPNECEWLSLVAEFPTTGLTVKEFVAKHDVSKKYIQVLDSERHVSQLASSVGAVKG